MESLKIHKMDSKAFNYQNIFFNNKGENQISSTVTEILGFWINPLIFFIYPSISENIDITKCNYHLFIDDFLKNNLIFPVLYFNRII